MKIINSSFSLFEEKVQAKATEQVAPVETNWWERAWSKGQRTCIQAPVLHKDHPMVGAGSVRPYQSLQKTPQAPSLSADTGAISRRKQHGAFSAYWYKHSTCWHLSASTGRRWRRKSHKFWLQSLMNLPMELAAASRDGIRTVQKLWGSPSVARLFRPGGKCFLRVKFYQDLSV